MTAVRDRSDGGSAEEWLDRVARCVESETFAVAFVWWAALVSLAPLCVLCALGFHASGAVHVGLAFGLLGIAVGGVALHRLVSMAGLSGRAPPA